MTAMLGQEEAVMRLGERVAELRAGRGWTQAELAARAEVSRVHVGQLERGDRNTGVASVLRIARALGVPAADLFLSRSP